MLNLSKAQFGQPNKMDMDVWGGQAWAMGNQTPLVNDHASASATGAAGEFKESQATH